jgi:hypothetical protein
MTVIKDVMVDLETMGSTPGSVILSIGAQPFDAFDELLTDGLGGDGFYTVINLNSCVVAGLTFDGETLDWWRRQSPEANAVIDEAMSGQHPSLELALDMLNHFLSRFGPEVRVWGNGSDFDNALLAAAYRRTARAPGWKFYNSRCYRTLKTQRPDIPLGDRRGVHHNALDDARTQAVHACAILKAMAGAPATQAMRDVVAERRRHVEAEGFTADHDDLHVDGQLSRAAACYALFRIASISDETEPGLLGRLWPWDGAWWKPKDLRQDLVRAASLIIAEIERVDRRAAHRA